LSNFEIDQVFSFENNSGPSNPSEQPDVLSAPASPDQAAMTKALESAGEAAYHWSIGSDVIEWSANTGAIFGCSRETIGSGKRFASFMDTENLTSRFDAVMRTQKKDDGAGVAFRIEYLFKSTMGSTKSVWVEDQGRWYAGPDGRPAEVFGTLRPIDDRHQRDQHLNFLGNCDPLTGMMNRGRMTEALGEAISVAAREKSHCAFAIAAVNNLSVVKEAYGFEVADEVIVALGRRLREVMRSGDGIARYSGGKFGIILNNCDEKELQIALQRYIETVRDSVIETQHGPVWAMLSIGALCLPTEANDANTATARAEEALNEARRMPSDGYVIFKPSEVRTNERKLNARCATEIVRCLKSNLFKLAYQPIVSAQTGDIVMHEALLRMADEDSQELIAAQHLMPVSERLGLVRLIDRSVTQMITNTLHEYPSANLTMNISATTATDPRWYDQILEVIDANSVVANRLTVEITETVALSDIAATHNFVDSLRRSGCKVAIDDFGAGYTSFRNLRDLHVDIIKLDGSFCRNLKANPENEYFVRSLIEMGKKFDLKTIAEWIETQEDADSLRAWGIDYLQGHLIGEASIIPPWPKSEVAVFSMAPTPAFQTSTSETQPEAKLELVVEAGVLDTPAEPEVLVETFEAQEEPEPREDYAELSFAGLDESIFALKQTLSALTEVSEPKDAERNAA
jgi:diguanylate cyclase (GGDEF)-like protein